MRDRSLGLKFRCQIAIDNDVLDFFCFEKLLAMNLDGGVHSQPSQRTKDAAKDALLIKLDVAVQRLPNGSVL